MYIIKDYADAGRHTFQGMWYGLDRFVRGMPCGKHSMCDTIPVGIKEMSFEIAT